MSVSPQQRRAPSQPAIDADHSGIEHPHSVRQIKVYAQFKATQHQSCGNAWIGSRRQAEARAFPDEWALNFHSIGEVQEVIINHCIASCRKEPHGSTMRPIRALPYDIQWVHIIVLVALGSVRLDLNLPPKSVGKLASPILEHRSSEFRKFCQIVCVDVSKHLALHRVMESGCRSRLLNLVFSTVLAC